MSKRVLFVTSEMFPLIKTGGLADVSHDLPKALQKNGHDVRVLLPSYSGVKEQLEDVTVLTPIKGFVLPENGLLLSGRLPDSGLTVWLVDLPGYFDRTGNPYLDEHGKDYEDNCQRFAIFSRIAMEIALGHMDVSWTPDVVHCNDWQTALVPAYLSFHESPPVIFTIHNLAYQGIFPAEQFSQLVLPPDWWHFEKLEFHGNLCLMKAGIICADVITTVSPNYAKEILTSEQGCGLEGVLNHYKNKLHGVLNGIDTELWNPVADPAVKFHFSFDDIHEKTKNKLDLQRKFGLPLSKNVPLIGVVSRLAHQKGIDLLFGAIDALQDRQVQWVILGSGDKQHEKDFQALQQRLPNKVALTLGYDEQLAHQIEAGADFYVMPSLYEPCGLNQMYSLRYGAVPVVRKTGGLADTVVQVTEDTLAMNTANGFVFEEASVEALVEAIREALKVYRTKKVYRQLQMNGMQLDFSWQASSQQYETYYDQVIQIKKHYFEEAEPVT